MFKHFYQIAFCTFAQVGIWALLHEPLYAKGMGQLSSTNEADPNLPKEVKPADGKDQKTNVESQVPTEEKPPVPTEPTPPEPSALSLKLRDKLGLFSSFGWAFVSKDGESWRSGGASDFGIQYFILPFKQFSIFSTFRYVPMDVTPQIENAQKEKAEFRGTIQGYLFGGQVHYPLPRQLTAYGLLELGFVNTSLEDVTQVAKVADPSGIGFLSTVGGGLNWQALERFLVGGKFILGYGELTTAQWSATFSFLF